MSASWQIEIEDASLIWHTLDSGQVQSVSAGTSSESQVIPDVNLTFAADTDLPAGLLDPEVNRDRARLRITDGSLVRYFLIEEQPGSVERAFNYPNLLGRAAAGLITRWPDVSYDWLIDTPLADIARQICTRNLSSQTGVSVPVLWLASQNPTIPGGRFVASKKPRFDLLKELAAAAGAAIRCSVDGTGFEVYDPAPRDLSAAADRVFANAYSLGYEFRRVRQITNAVRVLGDVPDYARQTLPVVTLRVVPPSVAADGASTATALAVVYDSAGSPVQHKAIVDEAITAGSYTSIPVSGCYSVQGVWLNTGSQSSPVRGSRVTPATFDAGSITVPDNATQLFVVSYTQAEAVIFAIGDKVDEVVGEASTSTGLLAVSTSNGIGAVSGVYRASDTRRTGTNFYTGGSFIPNTKDITLGISPGQIGTALLIDYDKYNGAPLSASISPSSVLCAPDGTAQSTVGAGTTVGTARITATALGQSGTAHLSLTGEAVSSMTLSTDKQEILVGSSIPGATPVSETLPLNLSISGGLELWWVEPTYQVVGVSSVSVGGTGGLATRWVNGSPNKVYLKEPAGVFWSAGTSVALNYATSATVSNSAGVATLTATVKQLDGSTVTDGARVLFSIISGTATLSAGSETTSGGQASVTLTAGSSISKVVVRAICGPLSAQVTVSVVKQVGTSKPGTSPGVDFGSFDEARKKLTGDTPAGYEQQDSTAASGSICGRRKIVDCDGQPLIGKRVQTCGFGSVLTDEQGYFEFCCGVVGENTVTVDGVDYTFEIAPSGPTRGDGTYKVGA